MPVRPSRKAKWIATLWFRKLAAGAIGTLVYPIWTRAGSLVAHDVASLRLRSRDGPLELPFTSI